MRSHPHGAGRPLTASCGVPTSEGDRVASPRPPTGSYEEVVRAPGVSVGCTPQSFQGQAARRKRREAVLDLIRTLGQGGLQGLIPRSHTCTHVHLHMYICILTCVHSQCILTCACIYIYTCMCVLECARSFILLHVDTHSHADMNIHIHTGTNINTPCRHMNAHMYTFAHLETFTYLNTYMVKLGMITLICM